MAGLDDGFTGDARLTPGFTVGYLSQEPSLDPRKTVKENVLDGVREVHGLIEQYNAVMAKWSEPDADFEAIGAEQSALEDRINAADAWNLERNVEIAMDALRCPPDDADVTTVTLTASAASVTEGGSVVYTATVNNAVTGSPLVITLSGGTTITIPVGQGPANSPDASPGAPRRRTARVRITSSRESTGLAR